MEPEQLVLETLKKRPDFLHIQQQGKKFVRPRLVVQMLRRDGASTLPLQTVRVGVTATKTLGNAVVRNRVKRRLRALARTVLARCARPGFDYILVGRKETAQCSYGELLQDLQFALDRLHK